MTGFDEKYLSKEGTEENETNEIVRDTNLEL
jgi:hypothetical protein